MGAVDWWERDTLEEDIDTCEHAAQRHRGHAERTTLARLAAAHRAVAALYDRRRRKLEIKLRELAQ